MVRLIWFLKFGKSTGISLTNKAKNVFSDGRPTSKYI